MPNDKKDRRRNDATSPGLSRRNFIAFAAGLTAAATGTASDREQRVIDMDTAAPGRCHEAADTSRNTYQVREKGRQGIHNPKQSLTQQRMIGQGQDHPS